MIILKAKHKNSTSGTGNYDLLRHHTGSQATTGSDNIMAATQPPATQFRRKCIQDNLSGKHTCERNENEFVTIDVYASPPLNTSITFYEA